LFPTPKVESRVKVIFINSKIKVATDIINSSFGLELRSKGEKIVTYGIKLT